MPLVGDVAEVNPNEDDKGSEDTEKEDNDEIEKGEVKDVTKSKELDETKKMMGDLGL